MALTVNNHFGSTDNGRTPAHPFQALDLVPDNSYPTGGYSFPAATLPGSSSFVGVVQGCPETVANRLWHWNNTSQKLFATVSSTGAQVANAVDVSADRITMIGVFV